MSALLTSQQPLLGFGFHLFKVEWPLWSPSQTEWPSASRARPVQTHTHRHERAALFNIVENVASVVALKFNFFRFPLDCFWSALCGPETVGRAACPGYKLWDHGFDPGVRLLCQHSECAGNRRKSGNTHRVQHTWETLWWKNGWGKNIFVYLKAACNLVAEPAGLCPLRLADVTSSSFSVSWDSAYGEFDFHRVTVTNTSVSNTLVIPKKERVAVVTGLVEGCTYNVSVERVRGGTAGSAASLRVSTGSWCSKDTRLLFPSLVAT